MATKSIVRTAMMLVAFASLGIQTSSAAVVVPPVEKTITCYAQPSGKASVKVGTVSYVLSTTPGWPQRLGVRLDIKPDDGKVIDLVRVTFYDGVKKTEEKTLKNVKKRTKAAFVSKARASKADVSCGPMI